jgi:uncharacterized MAPEG superfamily protein
VIIAHQLGAPQTRLDILAVLFVTLRIIYIVMYVAGLPTARSAIWALALLVNIAIFPERLALALGFAGLRVT